MVEVAVDRAIKQLSNSSVTVNAMPIGQGGEYIMPARTAEEIKSTPAADEQVVSKAVDAKTDEIRDPTVMEPKAPPPSVAVAHEGDELWL